MGTDRQSRTACCHVFLPLSCTAPPLNSMMNNNNYYKIDTELLICTIQNKRCIWDTSCEEYKTRDIKNNAFKDVAAVVVQDFDGLTEKEQNEASKYTSNCLLNYYILYPLKNILLIFNG